MLRSFLRVNAMIDKNSYAVHCEDIIKYYETGQTRTMALRGATLQVHPGELMMLVGPSGCGKTTLISIISGILTADSGECTVFGRELHHMNEREKNDFRRSHIGFVFQQFNLIPALTAAENVAIPLIIQGMDRKLATQRGIELLISVGLEDRCHFFPSQLSGGQQQRVAIARSIVHNPKLVVCDEPTSALDKDNGHKIMALLKSQVTNNDRSMIVVTHDSRAFSFADQIIQMDDGKVLPTSPYHAEG